jgi:hypothetical protein
MIVKDNRGRVPSKQTEVPITSLTTSRQKLLRTIRQMGFGEIRHLRVRNGEPSFEPPVAIVTHYRITKNRQIETDQSQCYFTLCGEQSELLHRLDEIGDGEIERITVIDGLPTAVHVVSYP